MGVMDDERRTTAIVLSSIALGLTGFLIWRVTRQNRRNLQAKEAATKAAPSTVGTAAQAAELPTKRRTFGESLTLLQDGNVAERCEVLEKTILELSFHDVGGKLIFHNQDLMQYLIDTFIREINATTPASSCASKETMEGRLCGWIIANISFIREATLSLPSIKDTHGQSLLSESSKFIKKLTKDLPTDIVLTYDVQAQVQSVFLSVLQIFVNLSSDSTNQNM